MAIRPFNALHFRCLLDAVRRLYFVSLGMRVEELYPPRQNQDPEVDEDLLIDLVERARNDWRPVWRRRCECGMDSLADIIRSLYPGKLPPKTEE